MIRFQSPMLIKQAKRDLFKLLQRTDLEALTVENEMVEVGDNGIWKKHEPTGRVFVHVTLRRRK